MTNLTAIRVPAWAWALMALAALTVLFLVQENGNVLSASQAMYLHELTHDARHALGVPCH
jgi:cobalt transporter subunit CbtB